MTRSRDIFPYLHRRIGPRECTSRLTSPEWIAGQRVRHAEDTPGHISQPLLAKPLEWSQCYGGFGLEIGTLERATLNWDTALIV